MNEYIILTLKDGKYLNSTLILNDKEPNVELFYKLEDIIFNVVDEYPFFALIKLRKELEKLGLKILCNGSREDVYPSGNSAVGIMAYELIMGKQAKKLVSIFDPVNKIDKIATIEEQEIYRKRWLESLK